MTSGSTIKNKIQLQIEDLSFKEKNLKSNIYNCEKQIGNLSLERENIYLKLAEFYLPSLDAHFMTGSLKFARQDVENAVQDKQRDRKKYENQMQTAIEQRRDSQKTLDEVTILLEKTVTERDKLNYMIKDFLKESKAYNELNQNIVEKETELEHNKERSAQIDSWLQKEIPAFKNNKIFQYLLQKGFGQTSYKSKVLIGKLDAIIAEKTNFLESKKLYDFLSSSSTIINEKIELSALELSELTAKKTELHKRVEYEYGLTPVLKEGQKLAEKREQLLSNIENANSEYEFYSQKRSELDNSKGAYYKEAIDKLKKYLKGDTIIELQKLAKKSELPEDDVMVERIVSIDAEIDDLKDKSKTYILERNDISKQLSKVEEIELKFCKNDYDSSRSRFDSGFNIDELLLEIRLGHTNSNNFWNTMSNHQHFKPVQTYSSPSSHSFGGGGFGGGGSFGGGGFSTSGGF
ncbi:MAG: hypothetical protein KKC26_08385 [Nanoarchaeota archaeon]|nr:hypothetical protein [Nanoarchaeota archaeon]MBU1850721.1 hypothetical protein [Nanoarchaeota archaeon]